MVNFQELKALTILLPLSVILPQTLSLIFQFVNIVERISFSETASWSCGISSVWRHLFWWMKFPSMKCTVRDMYERCWYCDVQRSVVMVHYSAVDSCFSTAVWTSLYASGRTLLVMKVWCGKWNLGSATCNKLWKVGLSTILNGCKVWNTKFIVARSREEYLRLLDGSGAALLNASLRVICFVSVVSSLACSLVIALLLVIITTVWFFSSP